MCIYTVKKQKIKIPLGGDARLHRMSQDRRLRRKEYLKN